MLCYDLFVCGLHSLLFPIVVCAIRSSVCQTVSRSDRRCCLRLPLGWESDELAVYQAFRSVDGQRVSNSVCLLNGRLRQVAEADDRERTVDYGEGIGTLYAGAVPFLAGWQGKGAGRLTVRHVRDEGAGACRHVY